MIRSIWYRLVLRFLPGERRDDLAGDLLEEAEAIEERRGGPAARRWLRRQALGFLSQKLRRGLGNRLRRWHPGHWGTLTDVKVGIRLSLRQPVASVTAVLSLAMAIGLAVVGLVFARGVAWPELPLEGGDRLYHVSVHRPDSQSRFAAPAEISSWIERARTVDAVGAYQIVWPPLQVGEEPPRPVNGARVAPGSFARLAPPPLLGRHLAAGDADPGAEPVAVIGEGLWRRLLDADPGVVGRRIRLGGRLHTVVGVLPEGWLFPANQEIWMPLPLKELAAEAAASHPDAPWSGGGSRYTSTWVQLPERGRPESVASELAALARAVAVQGAVSGSADGGLRVSLQPYAEGFNEGGEKPVALVVMGFLLVLLCGVGLNVANLVMARAARRAEELAIRAALGAPRRRLISQLFVESLVIGTLGAVVGTVLARYVTDWARVRLAAELPFWIDLSIDPAAVIFAAGLGIFASAIAGVVPAIRVTGPDTAAEALTGGSGRLTGVALGRTTSALLALQLASAVAVLTLAGLLIEGLHAYAGESRIPGANQILTAALYRDAALSGDGGRWGSPELHEYRTRIEEALATIPGAERTAVSVSLPRAHADSARIELEEGKSDSPGTREVQAVYAGPGFFAALGRTPRLGRSFTPADAEPDARRVAVVSDSFVDDVLGGGASLGRRFRWSRSESTQAPEWIEIVGVVPDLGMSPGSATARAEVYLPLVGSPFLYAIVRSESDPLTLAPALRRAVAEVAPAVRISGVQALTDVGWEIRVALGGASSILGVLGGLALLLSLASVYALASLAVTSRTREIGVRVALGASSRAVLRAILGRTVLQLGSGAVLGVALAVLLSRATLVLPFEIPRSIGWMAPVLAVQMMAAGLLAGWIPARRALRIDPMDALRTE